MNAAASPSRALLRRRALLSGAAALCAAAALGCRSVAAPAAPPGRPRLRLLGYATLAHKLPFEGSTVGGLSGIDFDPASGLWLALSDDRSELQPARFYTLRMEVAAGGSLFIRLLQAVTLRQADGRPFPPRRMGGEVVDPEAMRWLPGGQGVLWTSEGDPRVGQPPSVREARLDGAHVRDFALPSMFQLGRPGTGPRDNRCFEGLALAPDARSAWVAMEGALQQDGPDPTWRDGGGPCRLTQFDLASATARRQVAYPLDPLPLEPLVPGGPADNGISEILALDATRLLVMERAWALGSGTSVRLYEIDTAQAEDVLALDRIRPGQVQLARKTLVADFAWLGLPRLDNLEAMAWGPPLPNGRRTLYVASDDNFNPRQVTQFAAFEFLE